MLSTSQIIPLPTDANPLTLMSGCRDSLSLSITLPAAPPGSAAGFYFESAGSELCSAHAPPLRADRGLAFSARRAACMRQVSVQAERNWGSVEAKSARISCRGRQRPHHVRTSSDLGDFRDCFQHFPPPCRLSGQCRWAG